MALTDSSSNTTLYGQFPTYLVPQRAATSQATSAMATSSAYGATQLAWQVEVSNTLIALGFWKGAA